MSARRLVLVALAAALLAAGCATRQPPRPRPAPPVRIERRHTPRAADTTRVHPRVRPNAALGLKRLAVRDTAAASSMVRRCAGRSLLPDQESTRDATLSLLRQARTALLGDNIPLARSLARNARQLATSLGCR